jgi:inosine/xanthosine triphosphate pyrophosphatase family protein
MISEIGAYIDPSLQFKEITSVIDTHRTFESTKTEEERTYWKSIAGAVASKLEHFWNISPKRDINNDIYFVTRRKTKFAEFQTLLEGIHLVQAPMKLPTLDQEEDLVKCAVYRVFKAYKELQAPCFIEEAALNVQIPGYERPFPGHNYRVSVEQQIGKRKFAQDNAGHDATTLSVLAYTADGKTAHVFTGDVKGTIVNPQGDDWVDVDGWDPFFQPSGYQLTLAQLASFKHIVNMRYMPCAEMRSVLRDKQYTGVYELHITVYNCAIDVLKESKNPLKPTAEFVQTFRDACSQIGVKALVIGMDDPNKPDQLQTAAYHNCQSYAHAIDLANATAQKLLKKGFPTLRVRVEAMLGNRETPKTDEEAALVEKSNYFEFHSRLVDVPKERFEQFKSILDSFCKDGVGTHGQGKQKAYFSTVGAGTRYFANMRLWEVGSQTALLTWRKLLDDHLKEQGFTIAKEVKPEYCIYDEKPELDYQLQT